MKKIKITKKLLKILKIYTKLFSNIEGKYHKAIYELEKEMEQKTGIKGIEFFFCDGEFSGIGTPTEPKRMRLIHRYKLER